jgi:hypothetical protein
VQLLGGLGIKKHVTFRAKAFFAACTPETVLTAKSSLHR